LQHPPILAFNPTPINYLVDKIKTKRENWHMAPALLHEQQDHLTGNVRPLITAHISNLGEELIWHALIKTYQCRDCQAIQDMVATTQPRLLFSQWREFESEVSGLNQLTQKWHPSRYLAMTP